MPLNIVVCAKQVIDPEMPASAFKVDADSKRVAPATGIPPVINGFDENAVEAALRLKEEWGGAITVLSLGKEFLMDVMKKPVSMGADELVLVQDDAFEDLDSTATAYALSEAIKKVGEFDLVLCGRQASDWDNGQVPLGIAEMLDLPCVTIARKVEVSDDGVVVHRALTDGYEVVEARLPAVVTVSNELGEPRYPTLRGIMTASRKAPTVWTASDLGLDPDRLTPKILLTDLFVPESGQECEIIEGEDEADVGRKLALRLREEKLI
ncbi:MAG: electron transfer flavoprotein subunit beta/FixA family protein [SAR202 cluster bacterium]|jgi:electron transfer flavoprotein beta subunit|nr:electron transfer flavoprotein subunit beta/FixA family protein [SAR202 cluster bacterium]